MTKNEIIESVVSANVPAGAQLVQHDVGGGLLFARMTGNDVGGLKIIMAKMYADQLVVDTKDLGDTPNSALFERLHKSTLEFNRGMMDMSSIEAIAATIKGDHQKMIERLQNIALKLGVAYRVPDDPLMK